MVFCGCGTSRPEFTLTGTVTDAQSGQPIAGAWVSDANGYGPTPPWGGYTDSLGRYSYQTWYEEHNLSAQAPHYEKQHQLLITFVFKKEKEKTVDFTLQHE
ncbi:MAG: carboxypeptidase-like regulatory domain-containing protein [Calditrichota bacterium]